MGKLPAVKEFEGMGARYTVASAFGGFIEFDDHSALVILTVASHSGKKLIHPLGADNSKAVDFFSRMGYRVTKDGESLTEFEEKILRSAVDHSLTSDEWETYRNEYREHDDGDDGLFADLFMDPPSE